MKDNEPSLSAFFVMRGLHAVAYARAYPSWRHLVPKEALPYLNAFMKEGANASLRHKAAALTPASVAFALMERMIGPGIPIHYAARKLAIEHTVREAIKNGATQVIMVSGGFDTLALRLHREFPHVQFFETDHPATQNAKIHALKRVQGYRQGSNLHFLGADLGKHRLENVLIQNPAYDNRSKTVSIAEGLTMYLEPREVYQLLLSMAKAGCDGSQIIFSILGSSTNKTGGYISAISDKIQQASSEDYTFTLPFDAIPEFVRQRGFELNALSSQQDLQDRVGGIKSPPDLIWLGENFCVVTKTAGPIPKRDVSEIPPIQFVVPAKQ